MIEEFDHSITNRVGRPLHLTITPAVTPVNGSADTVILIHGFKGFRNWGFMPLAAQHLASQGFTVVRVDLSMNGMEGGVGLVTQPDDFGRSTISRDVDDLHDVVFWLQHDGSSTISDEQMPTIHLVGHSRGGGIALVAGRELLHEGLLGKVILWNSVGRWERWTERQRAAWFAAGFIEIENTRTGQMLKIFTDIVRDVEDHAERLSLLHAVKALRGRVHAVHSQADLTTPLEEVEALLKEAGASDVLTVLPGSTHTFGMTHPLQRITGTFVHVLDHTTTLLQQ